MTTFITRSVVGLGVAVLAASGLAAQQGGTGSSLNAQLSYLQTLPKPEAREVSVKIRASTTFRDDATAGIHDGAVPGAHVQSAFDLLAGPHGSRGPARGTAGDYSDVHPFVRTAWDTVTVGGHASLYVAVGHAGSPDVCAIDAGPGNGPSDAPLAIWRLDVKVLSATVGVFSDDAFKLQLEWTRTVRGGGLSEAVARERRTVDLLSSERHVMDFLAAPSGSTSRCANVLLDVSASVRDPLPASAGRLAYDVWFVHKDRDGRESRQHVTTMTSGRQVAQVLLDPLAWSASGASVPPDSPAAAVRLTPVSSLRGAIRPDGTIDVMVGNYAQVEAVRQGSRQAEAVGRAGGVPQIGVGPDGTRRLGARAVTGGFHRIIHMANGETASVVLMLPDADLFVDENGAAGGSLSGPGIGVSGGRTILDLEKFFAGTTTSLIVTVTRK